MGKQHDFRIFKSSQLPIKAEIELQADKGYQGIKKFHLNSKIPVKKLKNQDLSEQDKLFNHTLSSSRIVVEHVLGKLKVFRILSSRYRNRRRRFNLRLNLIAGIYNYELNLR